MLIEGAEVTYTNVESLQRKLKATSFDMNTDTLTKWR